MRRTFRQDRSGRTGGVFTPTVWARAAFFAPLTSSLILSKGTGVATFTRATTATVVDFEGNVKLCKAGEARFSGARRVENLFTNSDLPNGVTDLPTRGNLVASSGIAGYAGSVKFVCGGVLTYGYKNNLTTVAGRDYVLSAVVRMTDLTAPVGGTSSTNPAVDVIGVIGSVVVGTVYLGAVPLGNSVYRVSWLKTNAPASASNGLAQYAANSGKSFDVTGYMLEDVTGQSVQTASEYVSSTENSTGALGVKYFTTMPDGITPINSNTAKFAYNCLATGDNFSTPDAPANRITGNITLAAWVAPTSWTPATVQTVVSKDSVSAGGRSYALNIQPTTGTLRLNVSLDGSTILQYTSTVGTGFAAGTKHAIGVERESATGLVRFYVSEDKLTWTQLGATVAGTAGAIFAGNAPVQFGSLASTGLLFDGRMYDSEIFNGLAITDGGVVSVDFDPSNWTTGTTWTAIDSGEVWTINGNARVYQGEWDAAGPLGYIPEPAATNLFLNSAVGVTQTTPTLTAVPYTLSFKGTGTITGTGGFIGALVGTGATNRVSLTVTASALAAVLTVTGSCTEVQLELGSFATSYIPTSALAGTRGPDTGAYPTAGNIGTTGTVYLEFTPTHAPSGAVTLWGSYTDASNYTQISHNGTNLICRKAVAGVLYDATLALAYTAGTTYKVAARAGTVGQQLAANGVLGTANADTTAAVIAATMRAGANNSATGQPTANIRNFRTWTDAKTDAQLVQMTS